MRLEELPDLALHQIFLKLEFNDIRSLLETNRKISDFIRNNRLCYSKTPVRSVRIKRREDGQREVNVHLDHRKDLKTLDASLDNVFNSLHPDILATYYDDDELLNMGLQWWKDIICMESYNVVDYRRYLPHLDRCTSIVLNSALTKNLSHILASMETKNLRYLSVSGEGDLECTDDDLRKIGRLSNNMSSLKLEHLSEPSKISNDAILDMLENGSFRNFACVLFTKIPENMEQCLRKRDWVRRYDVLEEFIRIHCSNGFKWYIMVTR